MNGFKRLARCAKRVLRLPARKSADTENQKRRAQAQLSSALSPHLRKDVGVEDG